MTVVIAKVNTSGYMRGIEDRKDSKKRLEVVIPTFHSLVHRGYRNEVRPTDAHNRQIVTLQYFVESLLSGKHWAIEALHAVPAAVIHKTPIWDYLVDNKHQFYFEFFESTAFISRSIADYASADGPTCNSIREIIRKLATAKKAGSTHLKDVEDAIGEIDYSPFLLVEQKHIPGEVKEYGITLDGKFLHGGLPIDNIIGRLRSQLEHYSKPEKITRIPNWKVLAANMRLCCQLMAILKNKEFSYPLSEYDALEIKLVREGSCNLDDLLNTLGNKLLYINRQLARDQYLHPTNIRKWLEWVTQQYKSNI